MKELKRTYFATGIITIVLIGITFFLIRTNGSRLEFFGSYLGILICICVPLYSVIIQLGKDHEIREQEKKNSTFFSLLTLYNRQQDKLLEKENYFSAILEDLRAEIKIEGKNDAYEFVCKNKINLLDILSEMKKEINLYISAKEIALDEDLKIELTKIKDKKLNFSQYADTKSSVLEHSLFNELVYLLNRSIEIESDYEELNQNFDTFVESSIVNYISDSFSDFDLVKESNFEFSDPLVNEIEKFMQKLVERDVSELTVPERVERVQTIFRQYYRITTPYFRMVGLVLKFINKTSSVKKNEVNYLEILRANLIEEELLVLFYYAVYTNEGKELLDELKKTSFFGDSQELLGNIEPSFFPKADLLWELDDLAIMKENVQSIQEKNEIKADKSVKEILFNLFFNHK